MAIPRRISGIWKTLQHGSTVLSAGLLPGLLILSLVVGGRIAGAFQFLEWRFLDVFLRVPWAEAPDDRIVLVAIDEDSITRVGTYPIPDRTLAQVLRTLQQHHPRVIGLDLNRDLPVEPGYEELRTAFRTMDNLIGVEKVLFPPIAPPPDLPSERLGITDALLDPDGRQRHIFLGTQTEEGFRFSLAFRVAETYLQGEGFSVANGIQDPTAMRFGPVELPRFRPNFGGYVRADTGEGTVQMLVNFRRGLHPFRVFTVQDILTGNYDPQAFSDRIILIGVATPSIPDHISAAATSVFDPEATWIYGLEMQAHAVSQIISGVLDGRPLLKTWPEGMEYAWILAWGGLGMVFAAYSRSPWQTLFLCLGSGFGLLIFSYGLFLEGWWIPIVPVLAALGLTSLSLTAFYEHNRRIAAMVEAKQQRILTLAEANEMLEQRVTERTEALSRALAELRSTQEQLVESAKMAALGQLVAGVAHEVNTPVGCAVMAASILADATGEFALNCRDGRLKRTALTKYLETAEESSQTILINLQRAGDLIQNFKQVAIDRTHWDRRCFKLKDYLRQVIRSLEPHFRSRSIEVTIGGEELEIDSYPGAISEVMTNLVINSLTHAFASKDEGHIEIICQMIRSDGELADIKRLFPQVPNLAIGHTVQDKIKDKIRDEITDQSRDSVKVKEHHSEKTPSGCLGLNKAYVRLTYRDNGCGISQEHLPKIFEPFFTTARTRGGTGLGLHIVYNIVTQNLQGIIQCESEVGVGTEFLLELPLPLCQSPQAEKILVNSG